MQKQKEQPTEEQSKLMRWRKKRRSK